MANSNCPVCLEEMDGPFGIVELGEQNTSLEMDKDEDLDEDFDEDGIVYLHDDCEEEYVRKNNIFHCDICNTGGYKNNNNSICLYEHNKCVYKQPVYDDTIIVKKTPKFRCYAFDSEVDDTIIHKAYLDDDQSYHVNTYHKKCVPELICEICSDGFDENNYKNIIIEWFDTTQKYHIECCDKIKNLCFCKKALRIECDDCHKITPGCFNGCLVYYDGDSWNKTGTFVVGDDIYCDRCL